MNAAVHPMPAQAQNPDIVAQLASEIVELLRQREELGEQIRAKYQAAADLGVPKAGFKLAVAHSRLSDEKREAVVRGYRRAADALNLQLGLFDEP